MKTLESVGPRQARTTHTPRPNICSKCNLRGSPGRTLALTAGLNKTRRPGFQGSPARTGHKMRKCHCLREPTTTQICHSPHEHTLSLPQSYLSQQTGFQPGRRAGPSHWPQGVETSVETERRVVSSAGELGQRECTAEGPRTGFPAVRLNAEPWTSLEEDSHSSRTGQTSRPLG